MLQKTGAISAPGYNLQIKTIASIFTEIKSEKDSLGELNDRYVEMAG